MGFSRVQQIVNNCYEGGNMCESSFTKVPVNSSTAWTWGDLSGATGNPRPNYYVGTERTATVLAGHKGLFHGEDVAPKSKHLHKMLLMAPNTAMSPGTYWLLDYLLFYPIIDMDATNEQELYNTESLPRYTGGAGVRAFLVATTPYAGGASFFMEYTNSEGVSGQRSFNQITNTNTFIGAIVHSGFNNPYFGGPFIRTAPGDIGIRSVQSITFSSPNGGLAALILAKPIAMITTNESTASVEWDFLTMKPTLPRIYDGAYLGLIGCSATNWAASRLSGLITVIWN